MSSVKLGAWWPSHRSLTTLPPGANNSQTRVCRNVWKPAYGAPASSARAQYPAPEVFFTCTRTSKSPPRLHSAKGPTGAPVVEGTWLNPNVPEYHFRVRAMVGNWAGRVSACLRTSAGRTHGESPFRVASGCVWVAESESSSAVQDGVLEQASPPGRR